MSRLDHWLRSLGRPAVFAHRGASRRAPENSLAALRIAADLGADGVEFDVQATADGELIVFHDRTLARCTGALGSVQELPWAALRPLTLDRIDLAVTGQVRGERIPTLAAWLDAAPKGLFLNLEAKVDLLRDSGTGAACARALAAAGRAEDALVSSFHPAALAAVAASGMGLERGALVEAGPAWRTRLVAGVASGAVAVHPEHVLVTQPRVAAWHRLGLRVLTWTVDDPAEARRCLEAGVDGIISNRPEVARRVAEEFAGAR
jgi:glycerophosphoryl diester phosphodiesterase